jgi:hypothetical protein
MTPFRERRRRRCLRQQAEQAVVILERRAHYLELLSVATKPGVLLHILEAIDYTDAQLDALDPELRIPRNELVGIPRS